MGWRQLTDPREDRIERALEAIHEWSNDAIDWLYDGDPNIRAAGPRWIERFAPLVDEFYAATTARYPGIVVREARPDENHSRA